MFGWAYGGLRGRDGGAGRSARSGWRRRRRGLGFLTSLFLFSRCSVPLSGLGFLTALFFIFKVFGSPIGVGGAGLARRTGRQVMVVDVPQIKSKWVGESEKNIKALFDRYRALVKKFDVAPILLFNEADAIIGIRKQGAQNAVDKMENTIQNIILQEMETLDGILIATTNLTENLDSAFERRFLYKIRYEKPDAAVRSKIWHTMIPELPEAVTASLAEKFDFSGGQIENIARKYAVSCILHGESADAGRALEELCANERIDSHRSERRIGFGK